MEKIITMLNTSEVAQILGCSLPTAREIMHRRDFPLIKVGKNLKVSQAAFSNWLESRHTEVEKWR